METIPLEIITEHILPRLPARDVVRFCLTNWNFIGILSDKPWWRRRLPHNNDYEAWPDPKLQHFLETGARLVPLKYNGKPFSTVLVTGRNKLMPTITEFIRKQTELGQYLVFEFRNATYSESFLHPTDSSMLCSTSFVFTQINILDCTHQVGDGDSQIKPKLSSLIEC